MTESTPVKHFISLQKNAFDQCFSSMVILQAQIENIFFSTLENQKGLTDDQVKLLKKTASLFSEFREEYKKSILKHYNKFETIAEQNKKGDE